jgi:hypothetical protein
MNISFVMVAELYSIVGRPNVFSYGELRTATENFSSNNLLGEGGYGSVYKVSSSIARMDANLLRTCAFFSYYARLPFYIVQVYFCMNSFLSFFQSISICRQ